MHAFTDARGKTWELTIDVTVIKRVKGHLKINLYDLVDDGAQGLGEVLRDPCQLVDIIFVLCMDQAETAGISDIDFGRGFAGDSLGDAADAFVEELLDFFPDRKARENLRKLVGKGKELMERLQTRAQKKVDAINLERIDLEKVAAALAGSPDELAAALNEPSGDSPASSALIPAPSRSPSS